MLVWQQQVQYLFFQYVQYIRSPKKLRTQRNHEHLGDNCESRLWDLQIPLERTEMMLPDFVSSQRIRRLIAVWKQDLDVANLSGSL